MSLPGTAPSSQQAPVPLRSPSFPATRQHEYAPINPSQLREAHSCSSSPEDVMSRPYARSDSEDGPLPEHHLHAIDEGAAAASSKLSTSSKRSDKGKGRERASSDSDTVPNARTRLLNHANWDRESGCGKDDCAHGTFSPRPNTLRSYGSTQSSFSLSGFGGRYSGALGGGSNNSMGPTHADVRDSFANSGLGGDRGKKMSTTEWLAKQHGIKNRRLMYVAEILTSIVRFCRRLRTPLQLQFLRSPPAADKGHEIGTWHTTFQSSTGCHSINGNTFVATSSRP